MDAFKDRLRELRKSKGLSQAETARRLNINRITYSQYEMGRRHPDYETLNKIADFFGTSVDYLLGRKLSDEIEVIDIKEALESETKIATWEGKELTEEQRKALKEIFTVIRDRLLENQNGDTETGKELGAMTAV